MLLHHYVTGAAHIQTLAWTLPNLLDTPEIPEQFCFYQKNIFLQEYNLFQSSFNIYFVLI